MAFLYARRPKKATYERGVVACAACGTPIHIHKLKNLADEFSARCTRCGTRALYRKRALSIESVRERRSKPRAS